MQGRLVLFDIDGTLIDSGGAGLSAIKRAVQELHGQDGPELNLRGATDSGLVREILQHVGVEFSKEAADEFFAAYLHFLEDYLHRKEFPGTVFPGVPELLDLLREAGAALGLLTGNIAPGAHLKMSRFGLADYFGFGAYGDDHHDRNKLGPIALGRAEEVHGTRFRPAEAVVVGDTPKDIDCGKALGAVTLGVATGGFSVNELHKLGADHAVENFADGERIVGWLRVSRGKNG